MAKKTYLVGYDLIAGKDEDYADLFDAIKELASGWWHHLDSTWLIKHDGSAAEIRDALRAHIRSKDRLLVVQLSGEGAWVGFKPKGSKWLKDNL